MEKIKVGFARADITPQLGVTINGYYKKRSVEGVLDGLEINCLVLGKNERTAVIISVDNLGIQKEYIELCKDAILKYNKIDRDSIFIHCTHTHTGGLLGVDSFCESEYDIAYSHYVKNIFPLVVKEAIEDMCDATMGIAVSKAEGVRCKVVEFTY